MQRTSSTACARPRARASPPRNAHTDGDTSCTPAGRSVPEGQLERTARCRRRLKPGGVAAGCQRTRTQAKKRMASRARLVVHGQHAVRLRGANRLGGGAQAQRKAWQVRQQLKHACAEASSQFCYRCGAVSRGERTHHPQVLSGKHLLQALLSHARPGAQPSENAATRAAWQPRAPAHSAEVHGAWRCGAQRGHDASCEHVAGRLASSDEYLRRVQ